MRTFTKSEDECCDLVSNTWGASDFDEENPVVLWQWTHSEDVTRTCDPAAGCLGAIARKTEYLNVYWNHDHQAWMTDPDYKEKFNSNNKKANKEAANGFEIQDFNTPKKALKACQRIYGDEVTAISDVEFPADQLLPLGPDGFKSEWPCDAGCTYVHKAHEQACGVPDYGCYDCSTLEAGCPECSMTTSVEER